VEQVDGYRCTREVFGLFPLASTGVLSGLFFL
jgi:hypothetical protein